MPEVWKSMKELRVLATVSDAERVDMSGATVVVIDVLRATTSMAQIFSSGAQSVYPVAEVDNARLKKKSMPDALLCGERNGLPPEGFDMGNSPAAFADADLSGKSVIITTTNGTRAIAAAKQAVALIAGACVNATAVARYLCSHPEAPVYLLCAGTRGAFSIEDFYCAGLIAAQLVHTYSFDDFAWAAAGLTQVPIADVVNARTCRHLNFLLESGFKTDVEFALSQDVTDVVPLYDNTLHLFTVAADNKG